MPAATLALAALTQFAVAVGFLSAAAMAGRADYAVVGVCQTLLCGVLVEVMRDIRK